MMMKREETFMAVSYTHLFPKRLSLPILLMCAPTLTSRRYAVRLRDGAKVPVEFVATSGGSISGSTSQKVKKGCV